MRPRITVLMDLPESNAPHRATVAALAHAIGSRRVDVDVVPTDADVVLGASVVIGPGSPYRDPERAEEVIRSARELGLPLVGT